MLWTDAIIPVSTLCRWEKRPVGEGTYPRTQPTIALQLVPVWSQIHPALRLWPCHAASQAWTRSVQTSMRPSVWVKVQMRSTRNKAKRKRLWTNPVWAISTLSHRQEEVTDPPKLVICKSYSFSWKTVQIHKTRGLKSQRKFNNTWVHTTVILKKMLKIRCSTQYLILFYKMLE